MVEATEQPTIDGVDPGNCTKYDRNEEALLEFLMHAVFVAGKSSYGQAPKLREVVNDLRALGGDDLLTGLRFALDVGKLGDILRFHKVGQYIRIERALTDVAAYKGLLSRITIPELEAIHGIGPKTARFYVLHTRKGVRCAVLDTHLLKWLKYIGIPKVPVSTPPAGVEYRRLEACFLQLANMYRLDPADLDLAIWNHYARKPKQKKGG
jgi:hypothetical protein